MKKNSLSFKIINRILVFCIVLLLIIFSVYYYYTRSIIEQTTRENAVALAENTVHKIEEVLKPVQMITENVAWMMGTGTFSRDSIFSFLTKLVNNNPSVYASAIAYEPYFFPGHKYFAPYAYRNDNRIKTTMLGSDEYNYFIMDWYQIPSILQQPYWSEPYFDEGGAGTLLSTYSVPFFMKKDGQRVQGGVITIDISLERLTDLVNSVKILKNGYAFLISRNGVFVTHSNRSHIMNESIFTLAKEENVPQLRDLGRKMIKGESNLTSINTGQGKIWIYYTQLHSTKWSIGVVYPHEEMYASLRRLNWLILFLAVSGLALLVIFTIGIIKRLISPLTLFSKSARLIAEGNFNAELPQIQTNDEMKELHESFKFMQNELAGYIVNLKETTSIKEKMESELRIANAIQLGMVPKDYPAFPMYKQFNIHGHMQAAKEVGGDLFNYFMIDKDHLGFTIGDVSGKGIPAALFMAVTNSLIKAIALSGLSPAEVLFKVNNELCKENDQCMFVTLFFGILNIKTGVVKFANAGHNPFIFIGNNNQACYQKINPAIVLAAFRDAEYLNEQIILKPQETLFMYTDGVTEAMNPEHKLFGEERLLKLIEKTGELEITALINEIIKEVSTFANGNEQSDDITILALRYIS